MDESPVTPPVASPPTCDDGVTLSDRFLDVDPSFILIAASEPQALRFRLIEWLAESPNKPIKSTRKQEVAKLLDITLRQVERLLKQYWANTAFPSPVRYDFGSEITVYQGSQGLCCTSRKREPL